MYQTVINTLPRPILIDDHGRQVDGHDWATVDDTQPRVRRAMAARQLRVVTAATSGNARLAAVIAATEAANNPKPAAETPPAGSTPAEPATKGAAA